MGLGSNALRRRPPPSDSRDPAVSTADSRKNARATVRLRRARERNSIWGKSPEAPLASALRGYSGGVGQLLPVAGGQLDELAPQSLEVGSPVVVRHLLRVVGDSVDQAVGGEIAFDDEVPQHP